MHKDIIPGLLGPAHRGLVVGFHDMLSLGSVGVSLV